MATAAVETNHTQLYVKDTECKGKGLFSPIPIKEGDIIFEEKPLISCQFSWNRQYNYTACDNCMKSLETAQNMARRLTANYDLELPFNKECCETLNTRKQITKCPRCQISFCCIECFEEAEEKYHHALCLSTSRNDGDHPINKLEETWKKIHYPPETTTIMLIVRMIGMIIQSNDPSWLITQYDQFISRVKDDEYKITHKLLGEQFKEQLVSLYKLLKETVPIEKYPKLTTMDGFKSLFALIGMNGQGIGTRHFLFGENTMTIHNSTEEDFY